MLYGITVSLVVSVLVVKTRSSGLNFGLGKYDITGPIVDVNFMGYADTFQTGLGLHTRLYSRAFLIKAYQDCQPVLFISLDAGMPSQVLKTELVKRLQQEYGPDMFSHQNVMISATHTHSGPGGFLQYLLFDVTSFGFVKQTFDVMLNGILESVKIAYESMQAGHIYYSSGELADASINRSPFSYDHNPEEERKLYSSNVDRIMLLLKFVSEDGRPVGMLNWFAVHGTSMNNTNRLVSGDNKGLASQLFERWMKKETGDDDFVAAFAQANEGDVSPNTRGARCLDTGKACDELKSTCSDGRVHNCIAFGPGKNGDMLESTRLIAERQFEKAKELFAQATQELLCKNEHLCVDFRHQFVDMSNVSVTYDRSVYDKFAPQTGQTCPPALGFSFAAGTTDGPGPFDFTQGMTEGTKFWTWIRTIVARPTPEMIKCHVPKPILLATALMNFPHPWHPTVVETQIFLVGPLVIVGLPGEFTTMAGRRVTKALTKVLPEGSIVALAGLSNLYTHYITTFEEYQVQRYEGASTIYGPHTLQAYIEQFTKLADALLSKITLPKGPEPPFLLESMLSIRLPVFPDTKPLFRAFGEVWEKPKNSYHKSDGVVKASFIAGDPRNDLRTNSTYLTVEKSSAPDQWNVVYTDTDWETKFIWKRIYHWVPPWFHVAEVQWTIDSPFRGCEPGTYRIRHFGTAKTIFGGLIDYSGTTEPFTISC